MVKPKALALVITERLAEALIAKRDAGHVHLVVDLVVRLVRVTRVIEPDGS